MHFIHICSFPEDCDKPPTRADASIEVLFREEIEPCRDDIAIPTLSKDVKIYVGLIYSE
jgi:hypothetical protein